MRYAIVTFGCRVNQADSLRLEEDLRAGGNVESSCERADLVIVNTCSVTASADQGARQTIRRIARQNPSARIVATGCYATRSPGEVAALPGVVRVVRNEEKFDFLRGEGPTFRPDATTADRADGDGPCGAPIEPGVAGRTAFTLRVQSGCEERCSYCIIPTTRGASRSVPIDGVLGEVGRVAGAGFKEVALTGVHLGSYGRDLTPPSSLYALLRALDDVPDDVRFRISSLEPMDCTREIVDLVVASGRFLPHFHLPLQHAGNRMLRLMQRPYRLEDYRGLVDDIRARLPHAAIGSDMIVGFPGETDDDFAANLEYLPPSPLTHLHVFPYSDRPGTAASTMRDKVAAPVIRDRGARVRAISADLTRRFRESQAGTIRPGLTLEDGTLVVTDNYLKVRIPQEYRRNERLMVRICEVRGGGELVGRVV
ncbi:MAG: tRNA (N(6)-L-threonylcarbamoyladenosine(37)-C(2))-methylthiotransferase MtaB [Acidobacteria bacterium]|nr:MAG: tRNA (N(6)-L-threonylcarbamoyladenosine(37)-C(2))-methylthiotransferase MtaB [Acidobacteriota bacterium]